MEETKSIRVRIHVGTSVKGIKTPEHTVELINYPEDEIEDEALKRSDSLEAKLAKRYPMQIEGGK